MVFRGTPSCHPRLKLKRQFRQNFDLQNDFIPNLYLVGFPESRHLHREINPAHFPRLSPFAVPLKAVKADVPISDPFSGVVLANVHKRGRGSLTD